MALLFNGINQGLTSSISSLCQNTTQCALMAWINVKSFPSVSAGIIQININASSTASRINLLLLNNGALRIGGRAPDSQGSISSVDSTTTVILNTWYHVVGMIDYTTKNGYIYINAIQSSTTGTLVFANLVTDNLNSFSANLGSDENNTNEFCNVVIEDARVYHRILTLSEIQTIYACKGTDSIFQDMQARLLLIGESDKSTKTIDVIDTSNIVKTSSTVYNTTISFSYTVPQGTNLTLVVAVTGQSNYSSRVIATSVTFNGTNLTLINSAATTTSAYEGISLWYLNVSAGMSGNIIATFSGNNSSKTLFACTLLNSNGTVDVSETSYNNSGITTSALTTLSDGSLVISACSNARAALMTTIGTNHILCDTIVAGTSSAGAIGKISVPTINTVSNIGFTSSPTPTGTALVLASFPASFSNDQITDLSNNETVFTANNGPIYTTSCLKFRRRPIELNF